MIELFVSQNLMKIMWEKIAPVLARGLSKWQLLF